MAAINYSNAKFNRIFMENEVSRANQPISKRIDHFRVALNLIMKARLSAKFLF